MTRAQEAAVEEDRGCRGERGAVTAEFVVVLPAVVLVLALVIGAIMLATQRLTLTSAAADIARLEARGNESAARDRLAALPAGVEIARHRQGALWCVDLRMRPSAGALSSIELSAQACAAVSENEGDR